MSDNRPQGRKKNIGGIGGGLDRRGSGLNTGPVGRGSGVPGGSFRESGDGGNFNGKRGGGRSPLGVIIALLVLIFGGGGGLLSGLLGGGSSAPAQEPTAYVQTTPRPTPRPTEKPQTQASVSGMSGSLLVRCQNVADLIAVLVELVVDIQDGSSRISEHRINALFLQTFDDDF